MKFFFQRWWWDFCFSGVVRFFLLIDGGVGFFFSGVQIS